MELKKTGPQIKINVKIWGRAPRNNKLYCALVCRAPGPKFDFRNHILNPKVYCGGIFPQNSGTNLHLIDMARGVMGHMGWDPLFHGARRVIMSHLGPHLSKIWAPGPIANPLPPHPRVED